MSTRQSVGAFAGPGRSTRRILVLLGILPLIGAAAAQDVDPAEIAQCEITVWAIDKDPQGLNIRAAPGTDSAIIGTIPPPREVEGDPFASEVEVTGSKDGWFRIKSAYFLNYYTDDENEVHFEGEGWISGRQIGFSVEANRLHLGPSGYSPVVAEFVPEDGGADHFMLERVYACEGYWVDIEGTFLGKTIRGWTSDTCPNQVTTCP